MITRETKLTVRLFDNNHGMFKYRVKWHDANGAGESESGVVWEGFSRTTALEKRAECNEISRTIAVLTPSANGWRSARQEQWERQEREAEAEAEAEYYDRICLEHERAEYARKMARADTADVSVHITEDFSKYVVSITFYDEDGDADWGFSSYEHPTIRDAAAYVVFQLSGEEQTKAKEAMQKLGICWQ